MIALFFPSMYMLCPLFSSVFGRMDVVYEVLSGCDALLYGVDELPFREMYYSSALIQSYYLVPRQSSLIRQITHQIMRTKIPFRLGHHTPHPRYYYVV